MSTYTKFALVTGSSRGIGRGIALALAERGTNIAVHYHTDKHAAEDVLADVRARGADGVTIRADVTDRDDIVCMIERVRVEFGALDVLVSNARPELAAFYQPPLELSAAAWSSAMDSQATAFLQSVQAAAPLLRDGSRIIATSYSPSTRYGSWQPWAAMGAAKAAMESLVRYFAVALGPRGITVNCVSPGPVLGQPNTLEETVVNRLPREVVRAVAAWHEGGWTPMRRLATPADVGDVVAMLCTDEGRFVTGQTLHVDGGASLMDPVFPLQLQGAA